MTDTERIAELVAENTRLRQQLATALSTIEQMQAQMTAVTARLNQDSHNSRKPPASDGFKRRPHQRATRERKPGGQAEHPGATLRRQDRVDQVVVHRPTQCQGCQHLLTTVTGTVVETRQVQELPESRLVMTDHQVAAVPCPGCGHISCGAFPVTVTAAVPYGPRVRAAAGYLNEGQLLPDARTVEVLRDLFGCAVSEGSVETWVQTASGRLAPFMQQLADALVVAPVAHFDETSTRLGGTLHWLHTAATAQLTWLGWSRHRGSQATEMLGILPRFPGIAVHDRWATYRRYPCRHALCHAHLQRDLTALAEAGEEWAAPLRAAFQAMYHRVHQARAQGRAREGLEWLACWRQFAAGLNGGFATHPAPLTPPPKVRGRPAHTDAENLLLALYDQASAVMAFVDDPAVPLTNTIAEQALRMAKVQQKISGTFRSPAGVTAFCRLRSYIASFRKQGLALWQGLSSLFAGKVLLPAFA